jgi:hypothetical protein
MTNDMQYKAHGNTILQLGILSARPYRWASFQPVLTVGHPFSPSLPLGILSARPCRWASFQPVRQQSVQNNTKLMQNSVKIDTKSCQNWCNILSKLMQNSVKIDAKFRQN